MYRSVLKTLKKSKEATSDLQKGSLQSRNKFNPLSQQNQAVKSKQREWTHEEDSNAKNALPKMQDAVRVRALNKLHSQTEARRHPETGERMFLMHRGVDNQEVAKFHKDGQTRYEKGHKNSWTPNFEVASDIGGRDANTGEVVDENKSVVSAWIPESALIHSANQFNSPTELSIQHAKYLPKTGKIDKESSRSNTEKEENEWIVEHGDSGFHHANMDALQNLNIKINSKPKSMKEYKLAASEDVESDLNKMSQPSVRFKNLNRLNSRPDQQIKPIDPSKSFTIKPKTADDIAINELSGGSQKITQEQLEAKKIKNMARRTLPNIPKEQIDRNKTLSNPLGRLAGSVVSLKDDKGNINQSGFYKVREKNNYENRAGYTTPEHEGLHYHLNELQSKYKMPEDSMANLRNKLVNHIDKNTYKKIKRYIQSKGYKAKDDKFNEEILAHTRDLLSSKNKKLEYDMAGNLDPSIKMDRNEINNLKNAWKNITNYAKQLKEKDLEQFHSNKLAANESVAQDLSKTLDAGSPNAAPSTLTQGAALQSSAIEKAFASKKQRRFAYANPSKFGGKKGIKEWESKTPKNIPEKVKKKDIIPGGLADDKTNKDFNAESLKEGIKVETEHTSDPKIAAEIARDHLSESPVYYKKLKTIEKDEDYRGSHRAPTNDGYHKPMHDVVGMYPEDFYNDKGHHWYGHGDPTKDILTHKIIRSVRNNPEAKVKIYRAVPKNSNNKSINRGDWVTPNKQYAHKHGESNLGGDYSILEHEVPASHLFTDAGSIHEWGYDPGEFKNTLQSTLQNPLKKSEFGSFIRRGIMLTALGSGVHHLDSKIEEESAPTQNRTPASIERQAENPVEDTKYKAQKDAFGINAKYIPLSRNMARKAIRSNPELSEHSYILHLSPKAYNEVVENNPKIKQDVAHHYYDTLHKMHNGDQQKIFSTYSERQKANKNK